MSIDSNEWAGFASTARLREQQRAQEEWKRKREKEALEEFRNWEKHSRATILMDLFRKLVPPVVSPRRLTQGGNIRIRRRPIGDNPFFKDIALTLVCMGTLSVWLHILDISEEEFSIVEMSESVWGNGDHHRIECTIHSSMKDSSPEIAAWVMDDFIPTLRREAEKRGVDVRVEFDSFA